MKRRGLKRNLRRAVTGAAAGVAVTAIAFFLPAVIGEGSHSGETGNGGEATVPLVVNFPDGLTPNDPKEITVEVDNTTSNPISFSHFSLQAEMPGSPTSCTENLRVGGKNGSFTSPSNYWEAILDGGAANLGPYPVGKSTIQSGGAEDTGAFFSLTFREIPDESMCENATLLVTANTD